ncbi:MAG TPA: orotidine-5'-phosphate decarboxylase [Phycisphaerales bacterium]|nr:orotidine-5'-phosphate decarboxylase [Phycisphaerales bacterium]
MPHFADFLTSRIAETRSVACVGLDPVLESLPDAVRVRHHDPVEAVRAFCLGVIDAVADAVPAVKPQSACFERYGSRGVAVLEAVCSHARSRGLCVVLDAKRGDIGVSAQHYAAAAVHAGAHAITVNAYLGFDTVGPYLEGGLGIFALVRTSNPGSDGVQDLRLDDGRTIAAMMAEQVAALGAHRPSTSGLSDVGAVVGATKASQGAELRKLMPNQFFLVPGYGAQGGTADDIRALVRANAKGPAEAGVLVNASRSVIYAKGAGTWQENVRAAALKMNAELNAAIAAA